MSGGASPHPPRSRSARGQGCPRWLAAFERAVAAITWVAMALSAAGVLGALAFVTYGVVMRYVFNSAPTWVDDTVGYMLVGIVMLAAAATLRQGSHINVDILTAKLTRTGRRIVDAWSMLAVLAFAIVLIVNGWQTAMFSRMLGLNTTGNVEMPVFWLQLLMPLGGVLLLLASIEGLLRIAYDVPLPHEQHLEDVE